MTLAPTRTENRRLPAPSLLDLLRDLQAAAHEYIRALAIGEWRAGAVTAAEAEARSFALLAEAGVLPRPALLASLASLHAGAGGDGGGSLARNGPSVSLTPQAAQRRNLSFQHVGRTRP